MKLTDFSLEESAIDLYYPEEWNVVNDSYFQFKAVGFAPNQFPASIEYRGLTNEIKDDKGRDLYAEGWYEAIEKNFPEWKWIGRKKIGIGDGAVYELEGTYRVGSDTYRKIGRLRFHAQRIHAIYYTGIDIDFQKVMDFFNMIDSYHQYL